MPRVLHSVLDLETWYVHTMIYFFESTSMYEVTILNLHACCQHKNNCIWIDHIATDHASIEYEDKGLSRIYY